MKNLKPVNVLSKTAMVAALAAAAIVPVAATPAQAATETIADIVVTIDGVQYSFTSAEYSDYLLEDMISTSTVSHIKASNGKYYTISDYSDYLLETDTIEEALLALDADNKDVAITPTKGEFDQNGNIIPPVADDFEVTEIASVTKTDVTVKLDNPPSEAPAADKFNVTVDGVAVAVTAVTADATDVTGKTFKLAVDLDGKAGTLAVNGKEKAFDFALAIEAVSEINSTGVEVTFPEVTNAIENANVTVRDNKGNIVPTEPELVAEGETSATFLFTTPFAEDYDFTGVWKVNTIEVNFDAEKQLSDIVSAVEANNEIKLKAALDAAGITYADELKIGDYLDALKAEGAKDSLETVQQAITKFDQDAVTDAEKDAAVKAVTDATTQAQLLKALQDNFELVNADWIVDYETSLNGAETELEFEDIQNAVYSVNIAKVGPEVDAANMSLDSNKVATAKTLVNKWIPAFAMDDENVPVELAGLKEQVLDLLSLEDALIAVNNAKTNSSLKTALVKLDNLENTLLEKYKDVEGFEKDDEFNIETVIDANLTDYRNAIKDAEVGKKNQRKDIQTLITTVNESFGSLKAEAVEVAAEEGKIKPVFTIQALRKDGEIYEAMKNATLVSVKLGTQTAGAYEITNNFGVETKGELVVGPGGSAVGFDFNTVGAQTEATITFTSNDKEYTVKVPVKVVAGTINDEKTSETFDYTNLPGTEATYVSGNDIKAKFTLKDVSNNTVTSKDGTYASTITVGDDKFYQNITIVNGEAALTFPARTVTEEAVKPTVVFTPNGTELTVTASKAINIVAGEFSKLVVDYASDSSIEILATDGLNTVEDFTGNKLVNIKAVEVNGTTETPVNVDGTDYQGNVTKKFENGTVTHNAGLEAGKTYKVTVTVNGISTTKTITTPE
ncbi:hypothetical protein DV702_16515 [Sporosarcina sp. PTS2304]|uniref:hypothetical protein n=1 Tax=Sporosarcina sp. PTS2304 TaxID=2283194 RepID=UPI000E0DC712|nr:hypothetical protein [Sporosarcina sp. PTS2304]AXI01183.1 hypothetical protein DV702_16515 [Sporosarcina sp. PTS2304]